MAFRRFPRDTGAGFRLNHIISLLLAELNISDFLHCISPKLSSFETTDLNQNQPGSGAIVDISCKTNPDRDTTAKCFGGRRWTPPSVLIKVHSEAVDVVPVHLMHFTQLESSDFRQEQYTRSSLSCFI